MTAEVLGIPLGWLALASGLAFVATLLFVPVLVVRMPADYFVVESAPPGSLRGRRRVLTLAVQIGKNAIGVAVFLAGVALLVLPGQGILTMLLGLTLVDFPGKRRLELSLIRRRRIRRSLDWLRGRFGREPLQLPPEAARRSA